MKSVEHSHGVTSNTDEVYSTFIGCRVLGITRATSRGEYGTTVLIFDCGWGLAFHGNGSHWTEHPRNVDRLLSDARERLETTKRELEGVLGLAGAQ